MKNTMRKAFLLRQHRQLRLAMLTMALALIVAGGAFAQKVGDTSQFMGQTYRVQEAGNGRLVLQLVPSLDGVWHQDDDRFVVTFSGNTAVFTQFGSYALYQDAVRKGYIKVGDQAFRNLTSTGNLTWRGQQFAAYNNSSTPTVATHADWTNITITMSADGQSFRLYMGDNVTGNQYQNYTRRQ